MAEETKVKRPDTQYVAWSEVFDVEDGMVENADYIILRIGSHKKCLTRYELGCMVPNVAKCAKWSRPRKHGISQWYRHQTGF